MIVLVFATTINCGNEPAILNAGFGPVLSAIVNIGYNSDDPRIVDFSSSQELMPGLIFLLIGFSLGKICRAKVSEMMITGVDLCSSRSSKSLPCLMGMPIVRK